MPVRRLYFVGPVHDAQNGDTQGFQGVAEHLFVSVRADAVEHDARNFQRGVEASVAVDHGGDGAGHRPRVHDEHDGRVEKFGDVGRGGEFASAALAVEEAHHAFHDGYVGASRAVGEEGTDHLRSGEEGVEVAPRPACREGVVGGVYKVRADLEGGDPVAFRGEGRDQARGHGRFSDTGVGSGDDYARDLYHSMPFWPL